MKIREFITQTNIAYHTQRLSDLRRLNAPAILIENTQGLISQWQEGKTKIGGETALLDCDYTNVEQKKGVGGKEYFVFDGTIAYFPKARYGHFIKTLSKT